MFGRPDKYILDAEGNPVSCDDLMQWAAWYEHAENRVVARTERNGVRVSTVFLSLDHNHSLEGPPILWETMIFGDEFLTHYQRRYRTKEEALAGHAEAVEMIEEGVVIGDGEPEHVDVFYHFFKALEQAGFKRENEPTDDEIEIIEEEEES